MPCFRSNTSLCVFPRHVFSDRPRCDPCSLTDHSLPIPMAEASSMALLMSNLILVFQSLRLSQLFSSRGLQLLQFFSTARAWLALRTLSLRHIPSFLAIVAVQFLTILLFASVSNHTNPMASTLGPELTSDPA